MGLISEETIERVVAASDIVEVIGGHFKLARAGVNFKALCPFHQEKTPSFTVNPQRQSFHCFGCGAGGGVIRFVMDYENLDFPQAVRRLAERAGIPIIEDAADPQAASRQSQRKRLLALHQKAADWFASNLLRTGDGAPAREYLTSRAITIDMARSWKLGWAPESWDAFLTHARSQGFGEDELVASGLVTAREPENGRPRRLYDRFRGRVMFPICNDLGEVLAFSGRLLAADAKAAKYVNSPETPLFTKGRTLFGLDHSKRDLLQSKSAIVCEGQIDVIRLFESGFRNVIAPQGTAFTDHQARTLARYVDLATLCFDSDTAGRAAAEKSFACLAAADLDVRVIVLPPGEDPDSLIRSRGPDAFREAMDKAQDFFSYLIDSVIPRGRAPSPREQSALARRLAPTLAMIPDPIARDATLARVAARLEVGVPELRRLTASGSRPTRPDAPPEEAAPPRPAPAQLSRAMAQLILLALRHQAARDWLRARTFPAALERVDGVDLLRAILDRDPSRPMDTGSFLASLDPAHEALASRVLHGGHPDDPATLEDCWNALLREAILLEINALKSQLTTPGIDRDRIHSLQKRILDTQKQLQHIPRLSKKAHPDTG